jgi:hypothetical protein
MQLYPAHGNAQQQQQQQHGGGAAGQPAGLQQQQQQHGHGQAPGLSGQRSAPAASSRGSSSASQLSAKYELLGKIGEGTYGLVYLAYSRGNPSKLFAIKTFKTARVRSCGASQAWPRRAA